MAIVADSSRRRDQECEEVDVGGPAFDLVSLGRQLPLKRKGLSMYFSGKSRSFTNLNDVKTVEDLKKPEISEAKRKKYAERQGFFQPSSCRTVSNAIAYNQCVGV